MSVGEWYVVYVCGVCFYKVFVIFKEVFDDGDVYSCVDFDLFMVWKV